MPAKKTNSSFYISMVALMVAIALPLLKTSAEAGKKSNEIKVLDERLDATDRRLDRLFENQNKWQQKMSDDVSKVRADVSFIKGKLEVK